MFVRAQVILQGGSGLVEDQFVNTLHFESDQLDLVSARDQLAGPVQNFFNAANTLDDIGGYISQYAARLVNVRWYNLGQAEPRVPVFSSFTMAAPAQTSELPTECAVCLSLRGAPPVTPRRRGRVFIGPLASSAVSDGGTATPVVVSINFRNDLAVAAERLRTQINGAGVGTRWVIRSQVPSENFVTITGGWIDDALDTQRRRGTRASIRTNWGT